MASKWTDGHLDTSCTSEYHSFSALSSSDDAKPLSIEMNDHGVAICSDIQRGERLLNVTSQCWQSGLYSDVTIIVENKKFPANRIVLVALSDFFRPLFKMDVKDSEVTLHNVDPEDFHQLLQFAYTGQLELKKESVQSLLMAADYLAVNFVKSACESFMARNLDAENVSSALVFAWSFSLPILSSAASEFLSHNLEEVSQTQSFLDLDPHSLASFLSSDDLILYKSDMVLRSVEREKQIFMAVLTYLSQRPSLDGQCFENLMISVRLPFIPAEDLKKCLKPFRDIKQDSRLQGFLELRKGAENYLNQLQSESEVTLPVNVPTTWLRRRKLSVCCIISGNMRYAAGGELARCLDPPIPPHNNPDAEVSKIELWIRRWDGRPVIGAMALTYRGPPCAKVKRYQRGRAGSRWEHHIFSLYPQESISRVIIGSGYLVDRLGFVTTSGRTLGTFGGPGGSEREESGPAGSHLLDIICDVVHTQGADAIYNLKLRWLVVQ